MNHPYESTLKLFSDAKNGSGIQFVYTLVRAVGWEGEDKVLLFNDYLTELKSGLKDHPLVDPSDVFQRIIDEYEIFFLLANLLRNALDQNYQIHPLSLDPVLLGRESVNSSNVRTRKHLDQLSDLIQNYREKNPEFSDLWNMVFNEKVKKVYRGEEDFESEEECQAHTVTILLFLFDFLKKYYRVLRTTSSTPKLQPFPQYFIVFELLIDKSRGLYGFIAHSPDGSRSLFRRFPDRTEQESYSFTSSGEIILTIGRVDPSRPLWIYNGRPFYEIGFPGRYNRIGEWKPLMYPGSSDFIQRDIHEKTENETDKRISGCLLYIMATCHHAIEFIVKTNFEIPGNFIGATFDSMKIQLNMVDMPGGMENPYPDLKVYDGTIVIKDISVDGIKGALDAIGFFINRLAFRVDGKAEWKLKYRMYSGGGGKLHLSDKNVKELGEFVTTYNHKDAYLLDTAMGWYRTGRSAPNIFTEFLNYYIALESVAIPLANGELEISKEFGINTETREERKKRISECIELLHQTEYKDNQIEFVEKAYFDCIKSQKTKTKLALDRVFGPTHEFTTSFFDKSDGKSIFELRNDLAHGNFNHIDQEHAHLVAKKLPELKRIAFAFIMKISMGPIKKYSKFNRSSLTINMSDPRGTMIASGLNMLPRKDWKLRWEWLD